LCEGLIVVTVSHSWPASRPALAPASNARSRPLTRLPISRLLPDAPRGPVILHPVDNTRRLIAAGPPLSVDQQATQRPPRRRRAARPLAAAPWLARASLDRRRVDRDRQWPTASVPQRRRWRHVPFRGGGQRHGPGLWLGGSASGQPRRPTWVNCSSRPVRVRSHLASARPCAGQELVYVTLFVAGQRQRLSNGKWLELSVVGPVIRASGHGAQRDGGCSSPHTKQNPPPSVLER
jgi:hypothetical protein